MRTGIRITRKWIRTTRERNKEESKFLTAGDVPNTRGHINTVFTDGPGLYKFPSNIHLQVQIHVHLTNTRLNVLLLHSSSIPKEKCENTMFNLISSYRQTDRQSGGLAGGRRTLRNKHVLDQDKYNSRINLLKEFFLNNIQTFISYLPKRNPSSLQTAVG